MDISDDVKGELLLLTKYFLKWFRKVGFSNCANKFAEEANIDIEQPLDGSLFEYMDEWANAWSGMDYYSYFLRKKHKELKKHTFKGNASQTQTTTSQQPLSVDQSSLSTARMHLFHQVVQSGQNNAHGMHVEPGTSLDSGMISVSKRLLYIMLKRYMISYLKRNMFKVSDDGHLVLDMQFSEEKPDGPSGSTSSNSESIASRVKKRRRGSGENVKTER